MLLHIIYNKCSKIWIQKCLKYYTLNMGVRSGLFRVFNNEKPYVFSLSVSFKIYGSSSKIVAKLWLNTADNRF